ncbi:MAG: CAP domain-containing protein [Agathobaculum butyriciproducens]|nr:CAP domain-containing protein [Agathobaculum butyriciproducens]
MTKRIFATAIAAAVITTSLPTAGAANALTAVPTRTKGQAVYVGSTRVYPTGYNINDNNYFKLRDVGKLAGFGVDWNEDTRTVEISTTRTAPELTGIADTAVTGATAKPTDQRITVDGKEVSMTAYKIKGNNYVKLRDIGKTINFGVSFNMATKAVSIDPNGTYVEEVKPTTPSTPTAAAITKWNSTMDEFNEEMIQNHSDKDKLLAIAAKYGPTITGKANATTADVISALESMTGAPVDAISFDDKPVSLYWAKQLRKANGETVKDDTSVSDNQTSTGATVTDAMLRQWEQEMIVRINEERAKVGAPALVQDKNLMQWAQYWAKHLTTEFRHSVWSDNTAYAKLVGISADDIDSQENIASGCPVTKNPVKTDMDAFMASAGHRATLLDPEWTRVGVGFARSADGYSVHCAQEFMK